MTYVLKDPDETVRLKARKMVRGHFGSTFIVRGMRGRSKPCPNLSKVSTYLCTWIRYFISDR